MASLDAADNSSPYARFRHTPLSPELTTADVGMASVGLEELSTTSAVVNSGDRGVSTKGALPSAAPDPTAAQIPTIEAAGPWRRLAVALFLRTEPSSDAMCKFIESDGGGCRFGNAQRIALTSVTPVEQGMREPVSRDG